MATLECSMLTSCGTDGVFRSAIVCGPHRYELRVSWASGRRLIAVGLNPPGGDDLVDTSTVKVLSNYARRYRFGGLIVVNLYAWKATNPAHLVAASKRGEDVIGSENTFDGLKERIDRHYGSMFDDTVVACWGSLGRKRGVDFVRYLGPDFVYTHVRCFGTNKDGSPIHPLHSRLHHPMPPLVMFGDEEMFRV